MCICTGIKQVDPTVGLEGHVTRECLVSGTSVGVRVKTTRKLVAVSTCDTLTSAPELTEATYGSDPLAGMFRLDALCWKLVDVFQDPGVEKILEVDRVCVHPDYCRRGILKEMIKRCMVLGARQGCQLAHAIATSPYTERACLTLGFETRGALDFHTVEEDLIDLSVQAHKVTKIMSKRLSPEVTVRNKPRSYQQSSVTQDRNITFPLPSRPSDAYGLREVNSLLSG
ncbi:uncharacterized protein [Panulirus ornatus]|uniref:uncharacterized protein n=1 Tax=Panulirus ornatus TaxID=150431 RepID=UPI003A8B2842